MSWLVGIFTYVLIWWVTLFTILPVGVSRNDQPEVGHDTGAPLKAEIGKKCAYTTLASAVIWGIIFILVETGVINYREWVAIS